MFIHGLLRKNSGISLFSVSFCVIAVFCCAVVVCCCTCRFVVCGGTSCSCTITCLFVSSSSFVIMVVISSFSCVISFCSCFSLFSVVSVSFCVL